MSLPGSAGPSRPRSRSRSPTRSGRQITDADRFIEAARSAQERHLADCLELFRSQVAEGGDPAAVGQALVWRLETWIIDQDRQDGLLRDRLGALRDEFRRRADEAALTALREAKARSVERTS